MRVRRMPTLLGECFQCPPESIGPPAIPGWYFVNPQQAVRQAQPGCCPGSHSSDPDFVAVNDSCLVGGDFVIVHANQRFSSCRPTVVRYGGQVDSADLVALADLVAPVVDLHLCHGFAVVNGFAAVGYDVLAVRFDHDCVDRDASRDVAPVSPWVSFRCRTTT